MSGVFSSSNRKLKGWACLGDQPGYPVTVHLVLGNTILKSLIAEATSPGGEDVNGYGGSRPPCSFEFDLADIYSDSDDAFGIVIGESGERLVDAAERSGGSADECSIDTALTYRDALAAGMSEIDVVKILYLDILRRPIDEGSLANNVALRRKGQRSFELVRRQLLASNEYIGRRKLLRDAAGSAFRRELLWRSADAVLAFEPMFAAFFADDLPLPARLIRFFPGLLVHGDSIHAARRDIDRGLPEREVFQRALSRLAGRPALVLDPHVIEARRADEEWAAAGDSTNCEMTLSCASPYFSSGWHHAEGTMSEPRRWMKQIGIIRNPWTRRKLDIAEVEITGLYADTDSLLAASDSEQLDVSLHEEDGRRVAKIRSEAGPFVLHHLVLISTKATSPYRYDGSHDPRCLSFQVSQARFAYAAGDGR